MRYNVYSTLDCYGYDIYYMVPEKIELPREDTVVEKDLCFKDALRMVLIFNQDMETVQRWEDI